MPATEAEAQLSRFQTFESRRINRREIKEFDFNPRSISDDAKRALQASLNVEKGGVGLIAPVTWNEVTGRIVGGHQRCRALDALEGSDNYLLDVAVVHLSEAAEIAANVSLNNANLQGEWDIELLAQVLKTPDLDLAATGFTPTDISLNFDDPELSSLFQPNEATAALLDNLKDIKADSAEQKKSESTGISGRSSDNGADTKPDNSDRAKAFRKKGKEQFNMLDDTENIANVIFKTREERENFMERCGLGRDERYIDGSRVVARMSAT